MYPSLAFAPETSFELGASSLLLYKAKNDTNNRLSELQAFSFVTLKGQYGLWIDNALYGHQDNWFFLGKIRFQRFPLLYFGIGPNADGSEESIVDANYFLLRQRVLKKIAPDFFAGAELDIQTLFNTSYTSVHGNLTPPEGIGGSTNTGIGASLVYDNRQNVLNVRKGFFAELAWLNYGGIINGPYRFNTLLTDIRGYHQLKTNRVFAWQLAGSVINGPAPFNMKSLLGGENLMRGYYYGRYRDNVLMAAQAEYRILPFSFSKRWGAAAFAGAGTVAPSVGTLQLKHTKFAAGAGVRYLLFVKKDIFLRFDVGVTREGVNFYLFTGEAF
ncbi:MAG TPA: BamA/TamA family outer membrane protein [Ferruginibacter sp.]|nr:BamA/TamA family outer membrane protein [Ferruginibacter sp.]HPH90501.1 BamA/TamA family outer membrane protein [Ferruginibacter sp.]